MRGGRADRSDADQLKNQLEMPFFLRRTKARRAISHRSKKPNAKHCFPNLWGKCKDLDAGSGSDQETLLRLLTALCHCATVPLCHCATVPLCHCATVPLCHCACAGEKANIRGL